MGSIKIAGIKSSNVNLVELDGDVMTVVFRSGTYEYYGINYDKFEANFSEEAIRDKWGGSYGKAVRYISRGLKYKKISR